MEGRTISHFRVADKIGGGGMGVVYKAEDLNLGRPVALKFLLPEAVSDPERRERFLREARTVAALSHPGIASVFEIDEADGSVFIAMEFIEGKTLRSFIGGHALPVPDALKIGCEMAEALSFAHDARVIHRDLKPDNVMVRPDGHVKILDFGLAKFVKEPLQASLSEVSQAATASAELTQGMKIMGTAAYMSPEQARGERVDARADLFAFGVLLYEMLTGKNPFRRDGYHETLNAVVHAEVPPLSEARTAAPGDAEDGKDLSALGRVVARCLEKDRDRRYGSAAELRADIEPIRTRLAASQTGEVTLLRREPRRLLPLAMAGTAMAVAVLIGALAWQPLKNRFLDPRADGLIDSIAVLPFENLSNDPTQEFFADGLTDVLITDLSKIRALRIISRSTVMHYKEARKPLGEIARELNVDAVLEGTVMAISNRVRITAQLVRLSTGENLWADTYQREAMDVMSVQSEVAEAVVRSVRVQVTPEERSRLRKRLTENEEAYRLYLKGRYYLSLYSLDGSEALDTFRKAINLDPGFAAAYVGLAEAYWHLSTQSISPEDAMPKAKAAAMRALSLDPDLADAHAILGLIATSNEWDWAAAEMSFVRALELNPSLARTHQYYGVLLVILGNRPLEAQVEMDRAVELEPLSASTALWAVWPYYYALPGNRDPEEALKRVSQVLEMSPENPPALALRGLILLQMDDFEAALEEMRAAVTSSARHHYYLCVLGSGLAAMGDDEAAREILAEVMEKRSSEEFVGPTGIAELFAALGETEKTLEWLGRAGEDRDEQLLLTLLDPRMDPYREDLRFLEIEKKLGLEMRSVERGFSSSKDGALEQPSWR